MLQKIIRFLESIIKFLREVKSEDPSKPKSPIKIIKARISRIDVIQANPELFPGSPDKWLKFLWFFVHHSLTKDGKTKNWPAIWRYHTSWRIDGHIVSKQSWIERKKSKDGVRFEKPYITIGYNGGEETVGNKHLILPGRPLNINGAHTLGFNHNSIGWCVVGNYDRKPLPDDEMELLAITIKKHMKVFKIPIKRILGHRNSYKLRKMKQQKTCPGKKFNLIKLRSIISGTNDRRLVGI